MCTGVELAALAAAVAPEVGATVGMETAAALGPGVAEGLMGAGAVEGLGASTAPALSAGLLNSAPGVLAPGMEAAGSLDSMLINAGYPGMAGGTMTKAAGMMAPGGKGSNMLMRNAGLGLMNPPQQPQQPMAQPRPMQAQASPMGLPFGQPPAQGMENLTEEQKRRLRMMGVRI